MSSCDGVFFAGRLFAKRLEVSPIFWRFDNGFLNIIERNTRCGWRTWGMRMMTPIEYRVRHGYRPSEV